MDKAVTQEIEKQFDKLEVETENSAITPTRRRDSLRKGSSSSEIETVSSRSNSEVDKVTNIHEQTYQNKKLKSETEKIEKIIKRKRVGEEVGGTPSKIQKVDNIFKTTVPLSNIW